jgi:hypothetical protein
MTRTEKPIVARVNGPAMGGGLGLVAASTFAVADREATLGTPEINVGLFPMMIMAVLARVVLTNERQRVAASCGAVHYGSDLIDVIGKRALRLCGGARLLIVAISESEAGPLARTEIRTGRAAIPVPDVRLARDSPAIFLDWRTGRPGKNLRIDEVDVEHRTTRDAGPLPSLREANGDTPEGGRPNADGTLVLSPKGVAVTTRDGVELTRWGLGDTREARSNLVAFVHEGALEIVADLDGGSHVRVGAPSKADFEPPLLAPRAPCMTSEYAPYRVVHGAEALFSWLYGGSCTCDASRCVDRHLPDGVMAWSGEQLLAVTALQKHLAYLEKGAERGALDLEGYYKAGVITDGGKAAIVVTGDGARRNVHGPRSTAPRSREAARARDPKARRSVGVRAAARHAAVAALRRVVSRRSRREALRARSRRGRASTRDHRRVARSRAAPARRARAAVRRRRRERPRLPRGRRHRQALLGMPRAVRGQARVSCGVRASDRSTRTSSRSWSR